MDNFDNRTPEQEPENRPETERKPQGAPQTEQRRVYYTAPQQDPGYVPQGNYQQPAPAKGMPTWLKVVLVIVLVCVLIAYLLGSCVAKIGEAFNSTMDTGLITTGTEVTTDDATGDYIGIIHVEGTISEDSALVGYDHNYILKSIRAMTKDDTNKGIILYLDTPGGSVFASDELYFAIKDYQEKTQRPVYASMQSMAASGGYYISAPCDKIYANRNCWTGSIGVTMGEIYDLTGLLDKLGVKVQTITSGRNKAMGSSFQEMTDEQRQILQSLIDEAYDQFTGIVAEGRNMDIKKVRELADGRIYTAKQAKENGLIDEVGTYQECVDAMKADYSLGADVQTLDFLPADSMDLMSYFGFSAEDLGETASVPTAEQIQKLVDINGTFRLMYIAE